MNNKSCDVLVVGAGPVGLFCANELSRHGLSCRIIDKKSSLSDKSKALGLHIRTLDVFEDTGFIADILEQGYQVHGALFKQKNRVLANLTFADIEANRHFLIDLPQDKTERILYEGLLEKGLHVEWNTALTGLVQKKNGIVAELTDSLGKVEQLNASWLIACDGPHSAVRHLLQMEFLGAPYKENWWLADLYISWDLPADRMIIYPTAYGPLACFPMGEQRYRLVMTAPPQHDGDPTFKEIVTEFKRRSADKAILSAPLWITKFYLHHRQIEHYRQENVFVAGDAAHIHSPMGGQGLNTGIQDIYNLVWKLAMVHKKQAKQSLLDTYHLERYPVGKAVLKKTDVMTKMILIKNPFLIRLRNWVMSLTMSIPTIKNKLARDIAELDISYASSPIVASDGNLKQVKAGLFLGDFTLTNSKTNQPEILHSIIQGTMHHVFLFEGLNELSIKPLEQLIGLIEKKYSATIVPHLVLSTHRKVSLNAQVWVDSHQHLHREFGINQASLIFLRPDKYIGFIQSPIDGQAFKRYLNNYFK